VLLLALVSSFAGGAQVDDATAVRMAAPHDLIVAGDITPAQREALLTPINNLYGFWNNGSTDLLKKALSLVAIDILRVQGGKVTDNWHLEDNLGFEQQAGLLPM
jgi:hypothetical protein